MSSARYAFVVALVWRLGWLKASGIGRLGGRPVWLLAVGGLAYGVSASLYSFYGRMALDPSILIRMPAARTTVLAVSVGALGEEVLFRGLVLRGRARAAGRTGCDNHRAWRERDGDGAWGGRQVPPGDVVLLPGSCQLVPRRRIGVATVRVRDLALLRRALMAGPRRLAPAAPRSMDNGGTNDSV